MLSNKKKFRSHRSFLVNKFHITTLQEGNFVLTNGVKIPISRRKKAEADDWFFKG